MLWHPPNTATTPAPLARHPTHDILAPHNPDTTTTTQPLLQLICRDAFPTHTLPCYNNFHISRLHPSQHTQLHRTCGTTGTDKATPHSTPSTYCRRHPPHQPTRQYRTPHPPRTVVATHLTTRHDDPPLHRHHAILHRTSNTPYCVIHHNTHSARMPEWLRGRT